MYLTSCMVMHWPLSCTLLFAQLYTGLNPEPYLVLGFCTLALILYLTRYMVYTGSYPIPITWYMVYTAGLYPVHYSVLVLYTGTYPVPYSLHGLHWPLSCTLHFAWFAIGPESYTYCHWILYFVACMFHVLIRSIGLLVMSTSVCLFDYLSSPRFIVSAVMLPCHVCMMDHPASIIISSALVFGKYCGFILLWS